MADKPNTTISSIELVDAIPSDDKRNPTTLYIPINHGVAERNQHLGAFMDRWSGLEQAMMMVLSSLLGDNYETAEVMFYSTTNIKAQTDMIKGMIAVKNPQQTSRWRTLSSKCLNLSNNRNHLVHGHWLPEVGVDGDEQGRPVVTRLEWFRIYMTGDPTLNKTAAMESGKPKTGQHRYSLERIRRKIKEVDSLRIGIQEFRASSLIKGVRVD